MKRNAKRIVAALLASVLLFTDCASGFAAETNTEQNETEIRKETTESETAEEMQEEVQQDTSADEEPSQVLFELEELREQSAKQFRLSDGSILAAQYGMDVHYESEDGEWKEIDNRFLYEAAENEEDFEGYRSAEGAVEFKFAPQVQEGELVKITHEDYEVGFELLPPAEDIEENDSELLMTTVTEKVEEYTTELFPAQITFLEGAVLNPEEVPTELATVPAVMSLEDNEDVVWVAVDENEESEGTELLEGAKAEDAVSSVGYGNVLPGVSLQYILSGSSLKEYILVNERSDVYSYDFSMNLENLEPQMQEDGSILLKDIENGTTVYEIPAGYMTDAAGEYSDAVFMRIDETEDGNWILNVTADAEWINAEEREFPVQIDPTLNKMYESSDNMRGCYAEKANPKVENENPGNLIVGFDTDIQEARIYIQLRNLPQLPPNSVICRAACYFDIINVSPWEGSILNILAQKVNGSLDWNYEFTWKKQPEVDAKVMDYQRIQYSNTSSKYIGWDITDLIKEHYSASDCATRISTFAMIGLRPTDSAENTRGKVKLCMFRSVSYPFFSVTYRDTKGIEGYFTYQTHDVGNAGTAYVGDYNGQLTVVKPVGYYESTIMSYGLNLVYNSAYPNTYFSDNGTSIHSKNFANMRVAAGWKLSAQETITTVTLDDVNAWGDSVQSTWLIYNDSDGTEHYFKQSSSNTSVYEDEDGLNLTITKNGSDFIMKDEKDNEKLFKNGYLTKLTDANGNRIRIVYNNGNPDDNNIPDPDGPNRITAIYAQPKGQTTPVQIFKLKYNQENYLVNVQETFSAETDANRISYQIDHEVQNSIAYLKKIKNFVGNSGVISARYGYTNNIRTLNYMIDADSEIGLHYVYAKSMTGHRIVSYNVYSGEEVGSKVTVSSDEHRKTVYRDEGEDKTPNTSDDIITTYLFNQCGQTVNISTKDHAGKILGVTSSAYTENSGTSKQNNRLLQSISAGQSGVNLLKNSSFENVVPGTDPPQAVSWNQYISAGSGSIACRANVPRSGKNQYNLHNYSTSGNTIIYQTVRLEKDKTYTASAYVNTGRVNEFGAAGAAFVKFLDKNGGDIKAGDLLTYHLNEKIEDGWQRISVTYKPSVTDDYRVCIHWRDAKGTLCVDDVQLEEAETPSSYNLISNGSFEYGTTDWTVNCTTPEADNENQKTIYGNGAFVTEGKPDRTMYASQTIELNKSSDTTFLLSGWSKAYCIASVETPTDDKSDGTSKKFWGISLKFVYDDAAATKEYHFLPFSEYIREWQYASMAVVPKKADAIIKTVTITCCYYNNANTARFDNISLTEEPAQTYTYNSEGKLTSVKSTGNGRETYGYDTGTQNLLSVATQGSGTYQYTYKTEGNKHLPVKVTNGTVNMNVSYTEFGEAKETTLTNNSGDGKTMKSTAGYTNGLLVSQTDNAGATTTYTYTTARDIEKITDADGQKIQTYKDLFWDRTDRTYQSQKISLAYGYTKGMLSSILRVGYIESGGEKQKQVYRFEYDAFGNRTSAAVTNEAGSAGNVLATYEYNDNFENMTKMTYGPDNSTLATVNYTYDLLDRVETVTYDNDNEADVIYGYQYSADGSLSGIKVNGVKTYDYVYDSLGRLIYSTKFQNRIPVLRTSHQYDTSDRITAQNWQIGTESFSESYSYNSDDGTISTMKIGENDTLGFQYNSLKQLSKRTSPKLDTAYTYQTRTDNSGIYMTNRINEIQYVVIGTSAGTLPTLKYTYDAVGNITKVQANSADIASYEYDDQKQLKEEHTTEYSGYYVYDTYGNIRSKTRNYLGAATESYTFAYGNDG